MRGFESVYYLFLYPENKMGGMENMIQGVSIKNLKVIPDERGWLMEILRCDEPFFQQFGQVYVTTAYPGVVKAWHYHKNQTDNFTCIHGMMKVVLYDAREDSSTQGILLELFIGEKNPALIRVPPGVIHGFKAIGPETAFFLSIPTLPYNYQEPDEFRLSPDTSDIPYDWGLAPGLKHG
jgi:dTDP-4-dehydrorhamnose 3,5-epimerase